MKLTPAQVDENRTLLSHVMVRWSWVAAESRARKKYKAIKAQQHREEVARRNEVRQQTMRWLRAH